MAETPTQQERLQAIAEKRRRQAEIENKRRQLDEDRRQLQHLKSKALRERWLLEGTPPSASDGDSDMRKQMQEDEQKAQLLEGSICRLEKEIEVLENGDVVPAPTPKETTATPSPARATPSPVPETEKVVMVNSQQTPAGTPKVVHAVDGALENGIQPLSSSEVDELIHKADEVTLSETEPRESRAETVRTTPARREITGVQTQPGEATSGPPGVQPGQEPPVTMIFMGYQNVEDEAETKKVLGLQDTITAELVVIEEGAAASKETPAPPNGSAAEPPAPVGSREEQPVGADAPAGGGGGDPQDLDVKKQPCKCCSVM